MLCLRPEVPDDDFAAYYCPRNSTCSNDFGLPTNRGGSGSIQSQRPSMWRRRSGKQRRSRQWSWSFSSNDGCSTNNNSDIEEKPSRTEKDGKMCHYRNQLEQEVKRLQKQLQEEINLRLTLANAVENRSSTLAESPDKLPDKARELLDSVALLEIAVGKLEEELEVLQCQLTRERHKPKYHLIDQGQSTRKDEKPNKDRLSIENLWRNPNRLSEEMVTCMRDIFMFLSVDSSKDHASSPQCQRSYNSPLSFLASPAKTTPISTQFIDFGSRYINAIEVSWLSVGRKELNYGAAALKKFRFFVEQLAKVDPSCITHDEKLAFWINLYNAMIMHAYLAYGIPKSDNKLFSLMQKATYNVGGHAISVAHIEFIILKMKPPSHHPQVVRYSIEGREMYAIDHPEPLLSFALSCGLHSSPAVRIFKPETVNKQLKESLKDYVQATVGISTKGKVLMPKLLHSYAKGIVPNDALLPDWVCQFLSSEQAMVVRTCSLSRHKWRFLGIRDSTVLPFDSRFRYLFLLD